MILRFTLLGKYCMDILADNMHHQTAYLKFASPSWRMTTKECTLALPTALKTKAKPPMIVFAHCPCCTAYDHLCALPSMPNSATSEGGGAMRMKIPDDIGLGAGSGPTRNWDGLNEFRARPWRQACREVPQRWAKRTGPLWDHWSLHILIYIIIERVNRPPMENPLRNSKFCKNSLFDPQKLVGARTGYCASPGFAQKKLLPPLVLTTFSNCSFLSIHQKTIKNQKSCWPPHFNHFFNITKSTINTTMWFSCFAKRTFSSERCWKNQF